MVIHRLITRAARVVHKSAAFNKTSCLNTQIVRLISIGRCNFAERLYTNKHEWVEVDGKIGIVGISDYAQSALGDVVYAQLPDVDKTFTQNDECGALESVKAASELFTPVSGKVVAKNNDVEDTPSLINSSCYDKGWLFKIELNKETELKELMNETQYKEFLKSNEH
ncbi:hypothetical protein RN001_010247 [Aquatica leii]|uniref:Glycine cleavage system H protein n=1 Tax=Aquatica leii TaxID=1421715 RepID=A0AAN7S8H6_9COLE|nr:hypothetical protein RN001_010247 [Aquatica leii]